MLFVNRVEAGQRLAARLSYLKSEDPVVLGLPRGGVPVALEVARALAAPLDVILVRKLGVPFQPELAMGAIGEGWRSGPQRRGDPVGRGFFGRPGCCGPTGADRTGTAGWEVPWQSAAHPA